MRPGKNGKGKLKSGGTLSPGRKPKLPELDKLLADVLGEANKDGIEAAKVILMALRTKAKKGDVRAAEVLLDRAYGKAKQAIDHSTGGSPMPAPVIQIMPREDGTDR